MDAREAQEIIQKLADGVDPYSGERFPADSPYQQADTVRALFLAIEGLDKLKRSKARTTDGPRMAGQAWTTEEEERLVQQFKAKVDVADIATDLKRTEGAIWARLEKLGIIERRDFQGSTPHPPVTAPRRIADPAEPADEETPF